MDMCWEVRRELLNGKRSTGSYQRESRMWAGKARDVWTHLSRKIVLADRYHIFTTDEKLNMFEFFCREYARLVRRYIDNREDGESMNAEVVSVDLINLMDEDESSGMFAPVHDEVVVDSVHDQLHPEEKLWKSYWFNIFSVRTGERWMVNGIDEFISSKILKPLLSGGNYEEYAKIYNRAFLTEYTGDEMREAVENGDADGWIDKLDQFFMELDKLAQMQWLNVLENGEFHVYSFC